MYELGILNSLLIKDNYQKYRNYIREEDLTKDLSPILAALDYYWKSYQDPPSLQDLENICVGAGNRKIIPALRRMVELPQSATTQELLESFRKQRIAEEIAIKAVEASQGQCGYEVLTPLFKSLNGTGSQLEIDFITDDLEQILNQVVTKEGIRWRLKSLNQSLGSLRKGDFGFVFARPETGKTTFLASEVSAMVQNGSLSGPILWLNNEEQGLKVKLRIAQACLRKTISQLLSDPQKAKVEYLAKIGDRLKVYDSATISRSVVERMCDQLKPSLIVIDQIDKIVGFKEDRTDLEMGAIYQWARELAKGFAPVIGVCQADGTGEGQSWLTMSNVANAKTAKQAEADFIIGIGKSTAPGFEFHRYLNITKNKLMGDKDTDPAYRHAQITCLIRPELALYEDL
jgi:AAA domain